LKKEEARGRQSSKRKKDDALMTAGAIWPSNAGLSGSERLSGRRILAGN
jgi:hypothetical protein